LNFVSDCLYLVSKHHVFLQFRGGQTVSCNLPVDCGQSFGLSLPIFCFYQKLFAASGQSVALGDSIFGLSYHCEKGLLPDEDN